MKAAVVEDVKTVTVKEVNKPEPAPGEVLIRIEYCLLCTWEQRIYSGLSGVGLPFIPGHEASGIIERIPDETVTGFKVGDKVAFKTLDHCGHCSYCYQGLDNQCTGKAKKRLYKGIPGSGGLAQYITLQVERVFSIFNDISLKDAAFTEPLSCCIHSVKRSGINLGDTVVIFGAGIMGQIHGILALLQGARTVIIEPVEARRSLARKLGAHICIDPFQEDVVETVKELTRGEGADVVFITTNMPDLVVTGLSVVRKTGRIVLYGSFHPNRELPMDPNSVHYSEVVITGSSGPATSDFLQASRMLSYGIVPTKDFIYDIFSLEEIDEAFKAALLPDSYRAVVKLHT